MAMMEWTFEDFAQRFLNISCKASLERDEDNLAYGPNMLVSFATIADALRIINFLLTSSIFNSLEYELFYVNEPT